MTDGSDESGVCKLCGATARLVKSHIVPASFYRGMAQGGESPVAFALNSPEHPKRRPVGVYDPALVCGPCEIRFGPWDDYGYDFLHRPLSEFELVMGTLARGFVRTTDVNYSRLKLFVLSVLWRAHATNQPEFMAVDLGPYEPQLREMLLEGWPGGKADFPVMLIRYTERPGEMMLSPVRTRLNGATVYRFHFGGHDVDVYVGKGKPEAWLYESLILAPDTPVQMGVASMLNGPKSEQLRKLLLRSERVEAQLEAVKRRRR